MGNKGSKTCALRVVREGLWSWRLYSKYCGMRTSKKKRGHWDKRHHEEGLEVRDSSEKMLEKSHLEPEPGLEWKAEQRPNLRAFQAAMKADPPSPGDLYLSSFSMSSARGLVRHWVSLCCRQAVTLS